ncbi:YqcI/YcgG family protein [Pseudoneobacillus sp. C159]
MKMLYQDDPAARPQLEDWKKSALENFSMKMSNKNNPFPCIPATIGFTKNQLRYSFIGDPRDPSTIMELAEAIKAFSKTSRDSGPFTSLIVFYETPEEMISTYRVEDYENLFWYHLSGVSAIDPYEWPEEIPTNPHDPLWEFCYNGEKYFMYCATPAHKNRQSRHFDVMMLAITPRWVLQDFNKQPKLAARIKKQVRKRLEAYDSAPIHPDLNSYGMDDNFEWKQYFLRDDDRSLSKCPFHRMLRFLNLDQ